MEALAEQDVFIFVSTTGNDTNPGTQDAPLRSFEEAVRRLRPLWRKKQRIILAPGTYKIGDGGPTKHPDFMVRLGQRVGAEAEPLVIQGAFTKLHAGTVSAAAGNTLTDPALAGATLDRFAGARVRFTSGTPTGRAYVVGESRADTLTLVTPVLNDKGQAVDPKGAGYVIERPAVTVEYERSLTFEGGGATWLFMTGVRWRPRNAALGAANFFMLNGGLKLHAEACEWDMRGGIFQASQTANVTFDGGLFQQLPDEAAAAEPLTLPGADGSYVHSGFSEFGIRVTDAALLGGRLAARGTAAGMGVAAAGGQIALDVVSRRCKFTSNGQEGNSFLAFNSGTVNDAAGDAVTATAGARLVMYNVAVNGAKGNGVVVEEGAYAALSAVTGTNNDGHGLSAGHGARVQADAFCTVTGKPQKGVATDIRLGGATHPWSDVDAGIWDTTFARIDRGL